MPQAWLILVMECHSGMYDRIQTVRRSMIWWMSWWRIICSTRNLLRRHNNFQDWVVCEFWLKMQYLVSMTFSRDNKNVSLNTDCDRLSATYSYVSHGMRRLVSFMFCVLQASCGVCMVVQSFRTTRAILPSPKHLIHEFHVDFPWNSVPSRGFCGAPLVTKY